MNTDQIAYLIDIAKTGSINTTAKRMYCSQQSVSESIKRLESELGCTILERSKRGVSLTEDGKYVLQHVSPMLEQYQMLQQHFHNTNAPSGKLHLGVAQFATNIILTDLIFEMYRQHPNITLFTEELSVPDMITDVLKGKLDFGIAGFSDDGAFTHKTVETASLCIQPLYTDSVVCVMHRNNPLSTEQVFSLQQLGTVKCTAYNNYHSNKPYLTLLHVSGNTNIHKKFMQEENSVCLINSLAYKTLYPEKDFVAIPVTDIRPVYMSLFYRKSEQEEENAVYQSFIQTILKLTKQLQQQL